MYATASLEQWLNNITAQHPQWMALGLERVQQVAQRLEVLTLACPVITVAGTNGKGSTVATLTAIYAAAGYRVGSYTSPHLLHYNERIQINQIPVSDAQLIEVFTQIDIARDDIKLTYFEFSTLAALMLFKQARLDIVVLEVGLGGRLDAVNIIDADVAIITTIALDHQQWLGETREQIAHEKAGIFKAKQIAICGDELIPTAVSERAKQLGIPLYRQQYEFGFTRLPESWDWWNQQTCLQALPLPQLYLQNVATALQAIYLLQAKLPVPSAVIKTALTRVSVPGRWQIVQTSPYQIILDVAHNPAAAKALAMNLQKHHCVGKTYAIVGMLADKDIVGTLQELSPIVDTWLVADLAVIPRGATAKSLVTALRKLTNAPVITCNNVDQAFQQTLQLVQKNDRMLVFGSFQTVAPILAKFVSHD